MACGSESSITFVHLAPRFELVPGLMDDLFAWLADSDEPVLIKSCVFHWCFEDIHPFPDGNGRMGRLWQTVLLGSWNPLFYGAPIENIVWAHQPEYYAAIRAVEEHDMDIAPFIEFMLDKILRTLKAKGEAYEAGEESRVKSRDKSRDKVLCLLRKQPDLTQAELANALGLTVKAIEKIVRQLRDANLIKREGGKKFGRWIVA